MKKIAFPLLFAVMLLVLLFATLPVSAEIQAAPTVNGRVYGDGDLALYQLVGYSPPTPENPRNRAAMYKTIVGGTIYFAVIIDRSVVDNVFGDSNTDSAYLASAGWSYKGNTAHTFSDLEGSDNMVFSVTCGTTTPYTYVWMQDLVYYTTTLPAGWRSDVYGEDGGGVGDYTWPEDLVTASSLEWNMNYSNWDVTLVGDRDSENPDTWKSPASGAAATEVSHINVTIAGTNYTTATVAISGGGGSGAEAVAEIDSKTDSIIAIHVTDKGSGYTSPPTVTITGGDGTATAVAFLGPTSPPADKSVLDESGYPPIGVQPDDNITYTHDTDWLWEWPVVYEFSFPTSVCGTDPFPLTTLVVGAHNSPSKDGNDDIPLAVDLAWFKARTIFRRVFLRWETTSETNNLGFNIWRATSIDGERTKVNPELIPSQVPFGGGGAVYNFVDSSMEERTTYFYWLQDLSTEFAEGWSEPIEVRMRPVRRWSFFPTWPGQY